MTEIHTHKDCMFDTTGDSVGERHAHTVYYNICQVTAEQEPDLHQRHSPPGSTYTLILRSDSST
ncbi:hypothetical protein F7725_028325 [Dissostichus mawsoni]|uniref:Uncharacterized protein n=1 Tax=Dissostichus mawsoni TaxID=36200 RepID=A0A7J5XGL9_DISMA|nr:hypothetical protein F7725_028325 [Dissostichus mawsoni]